MTDKKTILVVEDEPDHRLAVQMIFEREEGLDVLTAGDTKEAEKCLQEKHVDLILLDIALPGETGMEFCARLTADNRSIKVPIIAMSAFPDTIWRDKALETGCIDFFSKPFDPPKLVALVKKTLGLS